MKQKVPCGMASRSWGQEVNRFARVHSPSSTYLKQNKVVEEYTPSHIGNGDTRHDYQRSQHEAFAPTFCDECQGRGIAPPVAEFLGVVDIRTASVHITDEESAGRHLGQKNNDWDWVEQVAVALVCQSSSHLPSAQVPIDISRRREVKDVQVASYKYTAHRRPGTCGDTA